MILEQLSRSFLRTHARIDEVTRVVTAEQGVAFLINCEQGDSPYFLGDAAFFVYKGIPYRMRFPDGFPPRVALVRQIRRAMAELETGELKPEPVKRGRKTA